MIEVKGLRHTFLLLPVLSLPGATRKPGVKVGLLSGEGFEGVRKGVLAGAAQSWVWEPERTEEGFHQVQGQHTQPRRPNGMRRASIQAAV